MWHSRHLNTPAIGSITSKSAWYIHKHERPEITRQNLPERSRRFSTSTTKSVLPLPLLFSQHGWVFSSKTKTIFLIRNTDKFPNITVSWQFLSQLKVLHIALFLSYHSKLYGFVLTQFTKRFTVLMVINKVDIFSHCQFTLSVHIVSSHCQLQLIFSIFEVLRINYMYLQITFFLTFFNFSVYFPLIILLYYFKLQSKVPKAVHRYTSPISSYPNIPTWFLKIKISQTNISRKSTIQRHVNIPFTNAGIESF